MGRRNNKPKFGRRTNKGSRDANWVEIKKENETWEKYYKSLGLIAEDEWDVFFKACQTQLPLTFRITGSRKHAKEILEVFKEKHLPSLLKLDAVKPEGEGELEEIEKPLALPWYPNELAWQLNVPKSVMKKEESYKKTQRFLVLETEVGNISRQEAVSMIPPLVLDVKPHHYVLDTCAAPGSKTAQLVESLHNFEDGDEYNIPQGFVMANDSDYKRSHMLVHQVKRLNSPNFVVINHDAQMLPKFKLDNSNQFVKFDRILCDVPCTGDGTMRKNITVWKEWNIGNGLGMHSLQLNILNRGIQLLKPGGRLVYSTCSLNPIENEAVISAALKKWGTEIVTVNCDDRLPGLIRRPGVSRWKVFNKEGTEIANEQELEEKKEEEVNKKLSVTVFPPTEEEAKIFHLENCIRVYPHLQNTGGFFITVIERVAKEETKKRSVTDEEESNKKVKTDTDLAPVKLKKEKLPRDANEEPFVFLDPNQEKLKYCWDFYGISDDFPKQSTLVRNATGEPVRSIYFVAPIIKDIISNNENKLKFIHSGLKLFVSQKANKESGTTWRLQNESLPLLQKYLGSQRHIVINDIEVLKILLLETFPSMHRLKALSEDFYSQVEKIDEEGCCFLSINRHDANKEQLFLPIWKGRNNINLMVNKHDTFELLYRIFGLETTRDTVYKQEPNGKNSVIVPENGEKKGETEITEEKKEDSESTEAAAEEIN